MMPRVRCLKQTEHGLVNHWMKNLPSGPRCSSCLIGGLAPASGAPPALGFMRPERQMDTGVLVVAEALGHHEAEQERALVGPAGFYMGRQLTKPRLEWLLEGGQAVERQIAGWSRDSFAYSNCLRCQPQAGQPNRKLHNVIHTKGGKLLWWAEQALAHCAPYLDDEINLLQPRCIVAFGETAFQRLTGLDQIG